jgi:hypothetical protein
MGGCGPTCSVYQSGECPELELEGEYIRTVPVGDSDRCWVCRQADKDNTVDLARLALSDMEGKTVSFSLCRGHALQVVEALLDRYYPAWGPLPLFDVVRADVIRAVKGSQDREEALQVLLEMFSCEDLI